MMAADTKLWEQAAFNDLVHRGGSLPDSDQPDLFRWIEPLVWHRVHFFVYASLQSFYGIMVTLASVHSSRASA